MDFRFWRRGAVSIEVDETGVRRIRRGTIFEQVRWDDLDEVLVRTTADGPAAEDAYVVLRGSEDRVGVLVPMGAAPEGLLERVQQLPGFDNNTLIEAMLSTGEAVFRCWTSTSTRGEPPAA